MIAVETRTIAGLPRQDYRASGRNEQATYSITRFQEEELLNSRSLCRLVLALGIAILAGGPAAAQTAAFSFNNTSGYVTFANSVTVGYTFTVNADVTLTELGFYDSFVDGLDSRHEIGVWDSGSNLLRSEFIGAGTSAPLIDQFRYVATLPLALLTGQTYTIGAFTAPSFDLFAYAVSGFASAPQVTYGNPTIHPGGSLARPTGPFSLGPEAFGPNFRFTVNAAPEPGSMALLAAGGLPLFGLCRRKFRR